MHESIGERFMRETSYDGEDRGPSDQQRGVPQPPLQAPVPEGATVVALPPPESLQVPAIDLRAAIEGRRSVRRYSPAPLTLDELAWLLWATQGVRQVTPGHTLRTVPSAGARHPLETYLFVHRVEGLQPGIWRYAALEHRLVAVNLQCEDSGAQAAALCCGQPFVAESAVLFAWVCVPYRVTWRYGERGYRDMHVDAGHVCQNLYLAAEPIGCGVCAILAYHDQAFCDALGLRREEQWLIYCAAIGKKA